MVKKRFHTLPEICEILNITMSQARALVKKGELPAIQVGGRGQWRVEISKLEEYIEQAYERTQQQAAKEAEDQKTKTSA
ncbi:MULTISPECIES: helix-turn-helix domain-containing protein [Rothia]|uniref:helix-turn-helix domain-containing protein n=1 Tax=Rothia TaxID=32207 RepID=UPI0008363408|nr:helix-turn-helix domain-containing protein [Rothia sp. ND6WE1A]SIJ72396.1 DNA binding domain, excisionase family [Mycobacteroides abscessus subsp. abscessus]